MTWLAGYRVDDSSRERRCGMSRSLLPMMVGLSVFIAGCEKNEPAKVTGEQVEKKVTEAAGAVADYAKQEKDEYVARAQKAIDEAKAEMDALKARAKRARASGKGKLKGQIKASERRWKVAQRKLGELKSASGEAWKDLKSGMDKAIDDLKPASAKKVRASSAAR